MLQVIHYLLYLLKKLLRPKYSQYAFLNTIFIFLNLITTVLIQPTHPDPTPHTPHFFNDREISEI